MLFQSLRVVIKMSIEEKIKAQLMQELYASIDRIYDSLDQHFILDDIRAQTVIKALNTLKDELYFVVQTTPLS